MSATTTPITRLFVLAGDANVVGYGNLEHLKQLDADRALKYQYYGNGIPFLQSRVFGSFDRAYGDADPTTIEDYLRVDLFGADVTKFGPEIGFGWTLSTYFGDNNDYSTPIIVLKAAGEGSLATDWNANGGKFYSMMLADIEDAKRRIAPLPEFSPGEVELCGVVWFHGYSDVFEAEALGKYETNLRTWVKSLREDLDMPELPIVIGEMGGGGNNPGEEEQQMRQIQSTVAEDYEGVKLAPTAVHNTGFDVNDPDQVFDEFFHYYGRADVVERVGIEFARRMIELLQEGDKLEVGSQPSEVQSMVPTATPTALSNSDSSSDSDNNSAVAYPFYRPEEFQDGRPNNNPNLYDSHGHPSHLRHSKSSKNGKGKSSKSAKSKKSRTISSLFSSHPHSAAKRRRHNGLTSFRRVKPSRTTNQGANR